MTQQRITRKVRAGAPASYSYVDPKQSEEIMTMRQIQDEFMALHQSQEDEYDILVRPAFIWSLALVVGAAMWFYIVRAAS